MNNIIRSLFGIAASTLLLSGCASAPPVKSAAAQPAAMAAPVPSYDEKADSLRLEQVKASACPADNKWETAELKKITILANACVKAGNWQKVTAMGDFMAMHFSPAPWGAYYLGLAAEARKDYPRATWLFELALKKDPKEGIFHYELGRIQWMLGADADAIKQLKMASEMNPSLTEAHWVMGQLAMQRQDVSESERLFLRALQSDAKHVPSLLALATLKLNSKDYAKAEEYLVRAVELSPRNSKARMALVQIQEEHLNKLSDALSGYKLIKRMNAKKELDENIQLNLDEKIRDLEKSISQVSKVHQVTVRTPSGERQVAQ